MSEGRTPTATFTQQRQLEQGDVDIIHQIVIRAQNDSTSRDNPRDALFTAYDEIHHERNLDERQDKVCAHILFEILNPKTPGRSLYHKWEHILQRAGISLLFDEDATTQNSYEDSDRHSDGVSEHARSLPEGSQRDLGSEYYPTRTLPEQSLGNREDEYLDNPPPYIALLWPQAERFDRDVLAGLVLSNWRAALINAQVQRLEARAELHYQSRLKRKVLKQCLAVFEDLRQSQIQADQIYNQNLVKNAFGKTADEYRVRRISSIEGDRLKGVSLYKLAVASRESGFQRKRDHTAKRQMLRKLLDSAQSSHAKQQDLENVLQQKTEEIQFAWKAAAIGLFADGYRMTRSNEERAIEQDRGSLSQASIRAMRAKLVAISEMNTKADDAQDYFLLTRSLNCMRSTLLYRQERKAWLGTWVCQRWRNFVKVRKHARYDDAYRKMRRTIKMNLARRLLLGWRQKLQTHEEQDSRADEMYQHSLMQRIVRPFIEYTYDAAQSASANVAIADTQRSRFLQQRAIKALQMKQQALFEMSDRAQRLQQYRVEQRAVQGLRQMQLKAFELQRRQSDAEAFKIRHDKRSVRNYLSKMRRVLAENRAGNEGALVLVPPPAITPARKREELLLFSSTRLSTTPAYTPFTARLRQGPKVLDDIDSIDEDDTGDIQEGLVNGDLDM